MARASLSLLAALAVFSFTAFSGLAQPIPGQPDPHNGNALAEKLCTNCHLVGGAGQVQAPADVPSFVEIANRQGQSTEQLKTQIMLPPHPMPEIPLERAELADLAAYILTLRNPD
jgi:mono/diheme cytochrome c family protein